MYFKYFQNKSYSVDKKCINLYTIQVDVLTITISKAINFLEIR